MAIRGGEGDHQAFAVTPAGVRLGQFQGGSGLPVRQAGLWVMGRSNWVSTSNATSPETTSPALLQPQVPGGLRYAYVPGGS